MTDAVTISLIAAISSTVGTVISLINNLMVRKTAAKVDKVEKNTDGINTALLKVTGEAEHAKGKLDGAAEEKANPS